MKKPKHKNIVILLFVGFLLLFIFLFFVLPFIKLENTLAIQIPQRLSEQIQRRKDAYVLNNQVSKYVKDAAVASQDRRFYANSGIDILATLRALYLTFVIGKRQGASTITEQLAKNVYYHDKDTFKTDIETKILALFITVHFSKDKILEMYLNDIYYGKGAYGIGQASTVFFHTTPANLSLVQSAYLITLINAPSYLRNHPNQTDQETKIVLQEMTKNRYITGDQESASLNSLPFLGR